MTFDIQLFADTVTSDSSLGVKFTFADDDNRTVNVPNPRLDITESEVAALDTWVIANNVVLGDKALANSTGIESATLTKTNRIKLDLTN